MKQFCRRFLPVLMLLTLALPTWARDWKADPPWVEIPFAPQVAVIGDVHGAMPEFQASLECLGVARRQAGSPEGMQWTGGKSLLILTGDFNDRGTSTREVYDLVRNLEEQAAKAGGRVLPLLGNHEVLLLNGTVEKWALTLTSHKKQHYQNTIDSFTKAGLDFHQAISPKGVYGAWIRRRPLFAIVNGWLFIHGGLPNPPIGRSELAAQFREGLEAEAWSKGIFMAEKGPLWNREWWEDAGLIKSALQAFGVRGVVFGHTIGALGEEGKIGVQGDNLVNVDVGMTPAYGNSKGGGLLITVESGNQMVFKARYPDFPEETILQTTAPIASPAHQPANETGLPLTGTDR